MYNKKRVLAIIPARGGSKGIKLKNIAPLNGKPLIVHTLDFVKTLEWVDAVCVTSDNNIILELSELHGAISILRPQKLSGDEVPDLPVIQHAIQYLQAHLNLDFEYVVFLQPTSPLRIKNDLETALDWMLANNIPAVWSISKVEKKYHPDKQLRINQNCELEFHTEAAKTITARQQLSPSYMRNGVFYIFNRESIERASHLLIDGTQGYEIMSPFVNIDEPSDLLRASELISDFN